MEKKLASVILGKSTDEDTFVITHWGIDLKLSIKPLSPNKIIAMDSFLCRIKEIEDDGQTVFHAMLRNSSDLKLICHAIAISTGFPFKRFVYSALMKLPLEDLETLIGVVIKQSNATFFLNIMASAKSMSLMKKKKEG